MELRPGLSPGQLLSRRFYEHAVLPRIAAAVGPVPHAAALLGDGSEVLGFDDDVSPDHDFGPRVSLFFPTDFDAKPVLWAFESLPERFEGCATAYGDQIHHVEVTTASEFFTRQLGYDPVDGMTLRRWLLTPTQRFAGLTTGAVFADHDGQLLRRRAAVRWYPDDVWRYVLAAGWLKVAQEAPFIGRAGGSGDDLGSSVVAGRIVRELIRLALLIERRWAPYSKWLGRAFNDLTAAAEITPSLRRATRTTSWREREVAVCQVGEFLIDATNQLNLAPAVDPAPRRFYHRDITVVNSEELANTLAAAITDPELRRLVDACASRQDGARRLPGAIDHVIDSVEVLTDTERSHAAAAVLGLRLTANDSGRSSSPGPRRPATA